MGLILIFVLAYWNPYIFRGCMCQKRFLHFRRHWLWSLILKFDLHVRPTAGTLSGSHCRLRNTLPLEHCRPTMSKTIHIFAAALLSVVRWLHLNSSFKPTAFRRLLQPLLIFEIAMFALLIDVFHWRYVCFLRFSLLLVSLGLYVDIYIYIVKRRRPRFVGGAIEISLIDWLNVAESSKGWMAISLSVNP